MINKIKWMIERKKWERVRDYYLDFAFNTPIQLAYELERGEIVCYIMYDEFGSVHIIDDEIHMYLQVNNKYTSKKIEDKNTILDFAESLLEHADVFKNGVVFKATITEID